MDRVFNTYDDKYILATKVYLDDDNYLYADVACETKLTKDEVVNGFYRNMMIIDAAGEVFKPVSLDATGAYASVVYVTPDSTTATTAVLAVAYSKEYTA